MLMLRKTEDDFFKQELHLLHDKHELKAKIMEEEEAHLCQIRAQLMVCFSSFLILSTLF